MRCVTGARNTTVVIIDNHSDACVDEEKCSITGTFGRPAVFKKYFKFYKSFIVDNGGPFDLDIKDVDFIVALYYNDQRYDSVTNKYYNKNTLVAVSMYADIVTDDDTRWYGRICHYWCNRDWRVIGALSKMLSYTCYDVVYDDLYDIVGDLKDSNGLMQGYKSIGFENVNGIFVYDKNKVYDIIRDKRIADECLEESHNKEYM